MRSNKKYNWSRNVRHYNFDEDGAPTNPTPDGDIIERAAYALYKECHVAEYAYVDMAEDESILVSNFKEGYEVHLNPTNNGGVKVIARVNRSYGKSQAQRTFKAEDDATTDAIRYLVWIAAKKFAAKDNDNVTHINRRDGIPSAIRHGGRLIPTTTVEQNAIEAIWNTFPELNDLFVQSAYYSDETTKISGHKVWCTVSNGPLVRVCVSRYGQDWYSVDTTDGGVAGIKKAFKDAMEIEDYLYVGDNN